MLSVREKIFHPVTLSRPWCPGSHGHGKAIVLPMPAQQLLYQCTLSRTGKTGYDDQNSLFILFHPSPPCCFPPASARFPPGLRWSPAEAPTVPPGCSPSPARILSCAPGWRRWRFPALWRSEPFSSQARSPG